MTICLKPSTHLNNTLVHNPYKSSKSKIKDIMSNNGFVLESIRTHQIFNSMLFKKTIFLLIKFKPTNPILCKIIEEIWVNIYMY